MKRGPSSGAAVGAALVALPSIGLFLAGLLPQQGAYANAGYGFPLLAALSAAGCLGFLAYRVYRRFGVPLRYYPTLAYLVPTLVTSAFCRDEGQDWPLLVALLFGPIPVLLAGLGGWVEA